MSRYPEFVSAGSINSVPDGGDLTVVAADGEHDLYTASDLRDELRSAIDRSRALVVDLTDATFVDSSIVGVLLDARRQAQDSSKGFCVRLGAGCAPAVRRIFEITGLIDSLPVIEDAAKASEVALAAAGKDA